jgi:hypothetical protein
MNRDTVELVSLADPNTVVFFDRHLSKADFRSTARMRLTMAARGYGRAIKHIAYRPHGAGNIAVGFMEQ